VGRLRSLFLVSTGLVACGPSFQAVYECDVHFEHCYALDESTVSPDAKKECWRDWLHGYTYGQSRDRVEYGGTRYSQLSLDPTLPSEDVSSTQAKRTVAAPVPTSAFAPPPNVSNASNDGRDGHDGHASAQAVAIAAPGAECGDACAQRWTACRSTCKDGACDSCDQTYRGCMPTCFRPETLDQASVSSPTTAKALH
jgi:hypothetical protein